MSKISDEIREWCDLCGGIIDSDDKAKLHALANRIDSELMELPRDRDGAPIHVGDTVYLDDGREAKVIAIRFNADNITITCLMSDNPSPIWCAHETLSHISPDSWERIADELERYVNDSCSEDEIDGMTASALVDFAERIRNLAKKEATR